MHHATPLPTIAASTGATGEQGWGAALLGALNAGAFAIPLSLSAVAVVYAHHAPRWMPAAVLVTLVAIALVQLATAGARRPIVYSALTLEAITLAALLDSLAANLRAWGAPDTEEVRLAAIAVVVGGASVVTLLLYLVRADRLTRYIPAPVFAGFSNSIAAALVISQASSLAAQVRAATAPALLTVTVAASVFAAGLALRRWRPRWPAGACALGLGLVAGIAASLAGWPLAMVGTHGAVWALPALAADFAGLFGPGIPPAAVVGLLAGHALVLGAIVFLNTSICSQAMSHLDDRPADAPVRSLPRAAAMLVAGLAGAAPVSGSIQTSLSAARLARLGTPVAVCYAALVLAVAASGVLAWIPLAAVAGAMLAEAWAMFDRESLRLLARCLRREPLRPHARDSLALVVAVTASALVLNIVAAVFAGLLLGLLLFAARNARRPVRAVLSGLQVASSCARSRADVQRLVRHGELLRVVELESDLCFAAVEGLEQQFSVAFRAARCVVVDWTRVRHVDTSMAQAVAKLERKAAEHGVALFHVDPAPAEPDVAAALQLREHGCAVLPDVDRALEAAENQLLAVLGGDDEPAPGTCLLETMPLFAGLTDAQREWLEQQMPKRRYRAGEVVLRAGEPGDELVVLLQGRASVLVPRPDGTHTRVAGVRRGAILGELAFLDRAPRSATVLAEDDVVVAVLSRRCYDLLGEQAPALLQKLLANLAVDLAIRLRHTTSLASERHARR